MQLVKPEGFEHWYEPSGKPAYGATLREARKQDLYGNVTGVCDMLAKPGLETWKLNNAILSALTLTRKDGEGLDDFAKRIVEDFQEEGKQARARGEEVHNAIEAHIQGKPWIVEGELLKSTKIACEWCDEHLTGENNCEVPAVNPMGFGGRIDFFGEMAGRKIIIDFKTQNIKGKKPKYYSTWKYQLAAYSMMTTAWDVDKKESYPINLSEYSIGNLVISTNADMPGVWFEEWDMRDFYADTFINLFHVWCAEKNYWPNGTEAVA